MMKQNNSNRMNHRNRTNGSRNGSDADNRGRNHSHRTAGESNVNGGRPRGNPRQMREKYMVLAQEAISSGNHIDAETYYQHADHYYRLAREEHGSVPVAEVEKAVESVEKIVKLTVEKENELAPELPEQEYVSE